MAVALYDGRRPASASRGKLPNQGLWSLTIAARVNPTVPVDSIPNCSQARPVTECQITKVTRAIAAMPRDTDTQKCASVSGRRLLPLPVQSCASCSLQGGTSVSLVACLSAAVVRSRDPCIRPTQLCPHGSAAAPPPALPAAHRLHCRTAARGWGCWPGLVLEGSFGNRTGLLLVAVSDWQELYSAHVPCDDDGDDGDDAEATDAVDGRRSRVFGFGYL